MKFYYVDWKDYSFHEIEGEYVEVATSQRVPCKRALLEGKEHSLPIDWPCPSPFSPNYSSSLERLKTVVRKLVNDRIFLNRCNIEALEKELNNIKNAQETLIKKTKHLFEDSL